ncbi:Unconventional myosin-If [Trichinella pseudospiralis]|uniref:Unconventional myosin-If n=1 Tax=Trichinella pseudospiralis TaxID=6337 RepID=A0A0V1JYB6_TRIPS|nr:Unconventional myosin-If [Trichinella pseudospiralis]
MHTFLCCNDEYNNSAASIGPDKSISLFVLALPPNWQSTGYSLNIEKPHCHTGQLTTGLGDVGFLPFCRLPLGLAAGLIATTLIAICSHFPAISFVLINSSSNSTEEKQAKLLTTIMLSSVQRTKQSAMDKHLHWQWHGIDQVGVHDMVLLATVDEDAIVQNLRKRYMNSVMFTYIGPVLLSVNPFTQMPYFSEKQMDQYQGANQYENPPHIYALTDDMYRNMLIDNENHCVIISGESGSGKTVSAKYIMNYLAHISGGGPEVERIKQIILETNAVLEAFGNAKTIRNDNSSRFGKYVEIAFTTYGTQKGAQISSFLLEKTRVVHQNPDERNFHIFYQLCAGCDDQLKRNLGITEPGYFNYLNQSGTYEIADVSDEQLYKVTMKAMEIVGIDNSTKIEILKIVSAILHIGNIKFKELNNYADIEDPADLQYPAYLLNVDPDAIRKKLTSRRMESKWGTENDVLDVKLNVDQAIYTRDALAKALYHRLFDHLVQLVNNALTFDANDCRKIGILDIYGFEIFENNGFEQFCINFVNEKLQQVFIELTLKAEQVVCDLIESNKPPGIFSILNDVCAQTHGQSGGDDHFLQKMNTSVGNHPHYRPGSGRFLIVHYAGNVEYNVEGFCEKNRDTLFDDLIQLMQSSGNELVLNLFPEKVQKNCVKTRTTTFGSKIRKQANELLTSLMGSVPHYIRCIKPNEQKRPFTFDDARVKHQVKYLGLKENIRVRRAGFAYRRPYDKFVKRYAILIDDLQTNSTKNDLTRTKTILKSINFDTNDAFCMGQTKVFIKNPETVFQLEEKREEKYAHFAKIIQRAWRRCRMNKKSNDMAQRASDILHGHKQRRRASINRKFFGDYIGLDDKPELKTLVGKREKIWFADSVCKYDRRFKACTRYLLLTSKAVLIVQHIQGKTKRHSNQSDYVVKRYVELEKIASVMLSPNQDDFLLLTVVNEHATLVECVFKTEFLLKLCKRFQDRTGKILPIEFSEIFEYAVKKSNWPSCQTKFVKFEIDARCLNKARLKSHGNTLHVAIGAGLKNTSRPNAKRVVPITQQTGSYSTQCSSSVHTSNRSGCFSPASIGSAGYGSVKEVSSYRRKAPPLPHLQPPSSRTELKAQLERITNNSINKANGAPKNKPPIPPKPRPKLRMLYSYEGQDDDELCFHSNDIIEIIQEDPSGWWQGHLRGKHGFTVSTFPRLAGFMVFKRRIIVLFLFKYCKAEAICKQNSILRFTSKEERFRQLSRLPSFAYSTTIIGISANTVIPKGLTIFGQSSCCNKRCSVYIIPTVSTPGISFGHLNAASVVTKVMFRKSVNERKSNMMLKCNFCHAFLHSDR